MSRIFCFLLLESTGLFCSVFLFQLIEYFVISVSFRADSCKRNLSSPLHAIMQLLFSFHAIAHLLFIRFIQRRIVLFSLLPNTNYPFHYIRLLYYLRFVNLLLCVYLLGPMQLHFSSNYTQERIVFFVYIIIFFPKLSFVFRTVKFGEIVVESYTGFEKVFTVPYRLSYPRILHLFSISYIILFLFTT